MPHTYQHLSSADISVFKSLLTVLGEAFNDTETYQGAVPSDTYLQSFLEKEQNIAIAALEGDVVIGGIVAYVLDKFERERREIYLYDLAVAESHRRQGVATGMIRQLQQIAKEKGVYVIFVQADKGDDPAIKLYESLGIREDVYHFDITV